MISAAWTAACVVLMFGYGPAFCWVARRRVRRQEVAAPVVGLTTAEWDELTALQDKARAEFDFEQWTKEMTA